MKTILISTGVLVLVATGCALAPTSFLVTSRIGNRGDYEGTNIGIVIPNPFARRVVRVEYVTFEGGSDRDDLP